MALTAGPSAPLGGVWSWGWPPVGPGEAHARHGPLLEPWQHHPLQGRGAALQDGQGRELPRARQRVHLPGLRALRAVSTARPLPSTPPPRAWPLPPARTPGMRGRTQRGGASSGVAEGPAPRRGFCVADAGTGLPAAQDGGWAQPRPAVGLLASELRLCSARALRHHPEAWAHTPAGQELWHQGVLGVQGPGEAVGAL